MKLILGTILVFFSFALFGQTLIVNEVSNGPSGNMEYVEFVVVSNSVVYDCNSLSPPCLDIRGWIFDDNSGYHGGTSGTGVASGAVRFSNNSIWSCVPLGTIILIYNNLDVNTDIPAQDLSMSDGNCRIVAPINNTTLFESNATTPGAIACSYPMNNWTSGGDWNNVILANTGDCVRIVNLSGCEVFSLCYGTANTNNQIYFSGSGTDKVWYFNGGDPYIQSNWSAGCAGDLAVCGSDLQTPGMPNNTANESYINQFNNNCSPISPISSNISSVSPTGCGCTGSATVIGSGSIPGYTYEWFDSSGTLIGTSSTQSGMCVGNYICIVTSSIGCSDTIPVSINSNVSTITPTFTQIQPVCSGGTFTLPTTSNEGILGVWSPAINNNQTTTYTFTPNVGQCATSTTMAIVINSLVNPTFSQLAPVCSGGSINLPTSSNEGISGVWSPTINNTQTTNYTFTPNVGQCASNSTMTVVVNVSINPTFSQIAPICNGGSINLPTSSNEGISGFWSPSVNNIQTTTYTFSPNVGQCASTSTMTVVVNAPTIPSFSQITPICSGETITFPTSSTQGISGFWSPSVNNTQTTTYTFTPNTGQCASSTVMTVVVNAPITPTFSQIAPICSGGAIMLPNSSNEGINGIWSPAVNNVQTTTYTFTPNVGQCSNATLMTVSVIAVSPVSFDADTLSGCAPLSVNFSNSSNASNCSWQISGGINLQGCTPNFVFANGGCYDVTLTATVNGCVTNSTIQNFICVYNNPNASFESAYYTSQLASTVTVDFLNNSIGATNYYWDFNDGSTSVDTNPVHQFATETNGYEVTLVAETSQGCVDSITHFIQFESIGGIYVPNSFTPDQDEFNQIFIPVFTIDFDKTNFVMLIFNRWGEIVFETNDIQTGWDGSFGNQGKAVQSGVYTYKIIYKDKYLDLRRVLTGHVNLIR